MPLVCSLVISVCQIYGQLPPTFTKLYENFILQTIRRHLKVTTSHNVEPDEIDSLNHLSPPEIAKSFQEMCQFAYINMKAQDNPKNDIYSTTTQRGPSTVSKGKLSWTNDNIYSVWRKKFSIPPPHHSRISSSMVDS